MKKFCVVMLMIMLILTAFAFTGASAEATIVASGDCGSYAKWQLDSNGVLTITDKGYPNCYMAEYSKDSLAPWHEYRDSITSAVITGRITNVGSYAFYQCSNLTSVTLSNNVDTIGTWAFATCTSLPSIKLPNSVEFILDSAFRGCSSLTSIVIPQNVGQINSYTFKGCSSLVSISLPDIGGIRPYAFADCTALTSIAIPDSVLMIEEYAFENCSSLQSVTLPKGIQVIMNSSFADCTALTSITIPDKVQTIKRFAFSGCTSLASVTLPDSLTTIETSAFGYCTSLTSITLPDSLTSIGYMAFSECDSLTSVTIPDNVTFVDGYVFAYCDSLTSVTIPYGVTYIGNSAFSGCSSLYSIHIPASVETIDVCAFEATSLSSVTIPYSVTSIDASAFKQCPSLKKVVFTGRSDMEIHSGAFDAPSSSLTIYCYSSSVADSWAAEHGYNVAYLDEMDYDSPEFITLPNDIELVEGRTAEVTANIFPDIYGMSVTWSSSDTDVVTVENGVLTGISSGTAVVTATYGDLSASMDVTVYDVVSSFEILPGEVWLEANTGMQLKIGNTDPKNAFTVYKWHSQSYSSLDVEDGWIQSQGIGSGDLTITATAACGATATCRVHICMPVTGIEFSKTKVTVAEGRTAQLNATVSNGYETYTNKLVTFSTSDKNVAIVDKDGVVTAIGPGTATITAANASGDITATCKVTVPALSTAALPADLTAIEAEAFMNTGFEKVVIPDGCKTIGAKAFADSDSLKVVVMPDSMTSIDETAFDGSDSVVIFCAPGSYAEEYAEDNDIPFIAR